MLINCAAYQNGKKIADIPIEKISDYLARGDCFIWVGLKDANASELQIMREEFGLHALAVEDAHNGHQRAKIEEYGNSLFVILHSIELSTAGELNLGEVAIFVGPNYILSVRSGSNQGFSAIRERCEQEPELLKNGPAFVLYAIMDAVVDRYFPIVHDLELQLETLEEKIFSKNTSARTTIEAVYELKRKAVAIQHTTSSLLEGVGKLHGGRVPQICISMDDYFRDISDHLLRMNRSAESIREISSTAIQVNISLISLNESEVTKKLASYGALFAVPTAIAGIYGMNFKFMPELEHPWGYPLVLAAMLLIDIILWTRFRKSGWL